MQIKENPVISFNSPGGVSEIITDNENGILIDELSPSSLASTIKRANARDFCRKNISNKVNEYFAVDKIIPIYEKIF